MSTQIDIPIGVVVAHERVDHVWQDEQWRPISVFLNPPASAKPWRELMRRDGVVHYYAGNMQLELHRKETSAYLENLNQPEPYVFVVLRDEDDPDDPHPILLHRATLAPYEAEAYDEGGDEIIGACALPDGLRELVEAFCAEHHVDEKFVKRKRNRSERDEPYQFGQEPLDEVRARMKGHGREFDGDA